MIPIIHHQGVSDLESVDVGDVVFIRAEVVHIDDSPLNGATPLVVRPEGYNIDGVVRAVGLDSLLPPRASF